MLQIRGDSCYHSAMSRAALSAQRALTIIDLMAAQPEERFTLTDIVRMSGTNAASCHAILHVLMERGYLLRDPERKTYRLAPAIVAIGEAAAAHDPLLERAKRAARSQAEETGHEVLLTARAGWEIIAVAHFPGADGAPASLRVGQRAPLKAPLGGLFVAWDETGDLEQWCAPEAEPTPPSLADAHRAALSILRERGFLLSLRTAEHGAFSRLLDEEEAVSPRLAMLLRAMDNGLYQPTDIVLDESYRVRTLSAPIFDRYGRVLYNVGIAYPDEPTEGRSIIERAARLVEACTAAGAADTPLSVRTA